MIERKVKRDDWAIIFDKDGTLLENGRMIRQAFYHTAETFSFPIGPEAIARVMGKSLEMCYQEIWPGGDYVACKDCHVSYILQQAALVKPYPGVMDTLQTLKDKGYFLSVVTGQVKQITDIELRATGLHKLLNFVVTAEDTELHKPNPDPIFHALGRCGIPPSRGVYVGDAKNDVLAGRAAGVYIVAIPTGMFTKETLLKENPDFFIETF